MKRWPQVLRVAAMAVAAVSVTWGAVLPVGVVAAAVGAGLGVLVGQRLGRSSLRLWAALAGIALGVLAAQLLAHLAVDEPLLPLRFGTGRTIRLAAALRLGSAALGLTAGLRAMAARRRVAVGLELATVAAAIPLSFTGHRDGVIARPLWLGDWAWQRGFDPAVALLVIGGGAVAVLAILLLAEGRSRRAPSAFLVLALLTALAIFLFHRVGIPTPDVLGGLADAGAGDGGGEGHDAGDGGDGGGSRRPRRGHGDGGVSDGGEDDESDDDGGGGENQMPPDLENASSNGQDAPMAVVILDDDYSPPSQGYYFRQEAWSELNGTRLVRATRSGVDVDVPDTFASESAPVPSAPSPEGRATVHTLVALLVDHPRPFALESPSLLAPAPNPNPTRFKRAYRVTSLAQTVAYRDLLGHAVGNPAWPADVRAHYLATPDDPRYAAFARSIVDRLPERVRKDPFAEAIAVKLELDDAFKYSLKHHHAGAFDPTADFLFGDRIGYCVHFAHAAVYLWRTLGIPARVGAGYRVDEDERHGGSSLLVRGRDAHAWPELYVDGYGWIVLDIAPKQNLDPPSPPVDTELQRMLGEMARSMPADPEDTSPTPSLPAGFAKKVARALLILAAVAAALLYAVKLWRRLAPRFARAERLAFVGYRTALDMLSEVGHARRFGESREAFARRLCEVAPSFEALTTLHLRGALGAPGAAPADARAAWRTGLGAVRAEIGAAAPRGRRIAGALDPTSFLRSR